MSAGRVRGVARRRRAAAGPLPVLLHARRSHARPHRRHLHRFARLRVGVHLVWREPLRRLLFPQLQCCAGRLLALVAPPLRLRERGLERPPLVHYLQPPRLPFQPLDGAVRGCRDPHRGLRLRALPHDPLPPRRRGRHVGGDRRIGRRALRRYARRAARACRHTLRRSRPGRRRHGDVRRRPRHCLDRRPGRRAEPRGGPRSPQGAHRLRAAGPGVRFRRRFRRRLLRHGAGGDPGPERGGGGASHRRRPGGPHRHCGRLGAARGLRRVACGRVVPRRGRPARAARTPRSTARAHPCAGHRLARRGVGHDVRGGHYALPPREPRLQALRAGALHRLLQPRHAHPHRRGRRAPLDQDEQVRLRVLRPRAGPHRTFL